MTDYATNARAQASAQDALAAIQSLTERLATLAPHAAPPTAPAQAYSTAHVAAPVNIARPSPAASAALARATTIAAKSAKYAKRYRRRGPVGMVVESFVGACSFIPYSAVALALRVLMAQLFFIAGQAMVAGPRIPIYAQDIFSTSFIVPLEVRASTFDMFMTQYAALPIPPAIGAYLASYGSFILPVLLVLGLATRFAAAGLLVMTAMIALVMPSALFTAHVFWAAILLVLISQGPGVFSLDHLIVKIAKR